MRTERVGKTFGTRTVIGRADNGRWIGRCSCGWKRTGSIAELSKPCAVCQPAPNASPEVHALYDSLVRAGVDRQTALRCSNRLTSRSGGRKSIRFRHLLAAYRAAIAETMREEHGE